MNVKFYLSVLLAMSCHVMATIRILSTGTVGNICESEFIYGTPMYLGKIRHMSQQMISVASGYENMRLFPILPTHLGCQLLDLEVVVVSPSELNIQQQEYQDLAEDIRSNFDDEIDVKLIIVDDYFELAPQIRSRMIDIHTRAENDDLLRIQQEFSNVLNQIASELHVGITNIQFNRPRSGEITVTLSEESRRLRNRFVIMARTRTRRIVRVN